MQGAGAAKSAPSSARQVRERDAALEGEDTGYPAYEESVDTDVEFTSQDVFNEVWERGKWLVVLMIFQSLASIVLAQFEDLIKAHVVIALFLTMV